MFGKKKKQQILKAMALVVQVIDEEADIYRQDLTNLINSHREWLVEDLDEESSAEYEKAYADIVKNYCNTIVESINNALVDAGAKEYADAYTKRMDEHDIPGMFEPGVNDDDFDPNAPNMPGRSYAVILYVLYRQLPLAGDIHYINQYFTDKMNNILKEMDEELKLA